MMFLPGLVRAENRAENSLERMLAVWTIISLACTQHGSALLCSQCTTETSSECGPAPPPATPCPSPRHAHCLTVKEYLPSLTDDADTANHHSALGPGSGPGSLLWLARTCVEEALEEACTPGTRDNIAVEVCRSHCDYDGCNPSGRPAPWSVAWLLGIGLGLGRLLAR